MYIHTHIFRRMDGRGHSTLVHLLIILDSAHLPIDIFALTWDQWICAGNLDPPHKGVSINGGAPKSCMLFSDFYKVINHAAIGVPP